MKVHGPLTAYRPRASAWLLAVLGLAALLVSGSLVGGARSADQAKGMIAFTREHGIYVMRTDGSGARRIWYAGPNVLQGGVAWSPDGKKLAFVTIEDGTRGGLYVMDVGRSASVRIRDVSAVTRPSWSPDGRRISFAGYANDRRDIWIVKADGSKVRRLAPLDRGVFDVDWNPVGGRLVFTSAGYGGGEIYVIDTDGRNLRRLEGVRGNFPEWSPDGRAIAFAGFEVFGGGTGIWVTNASGRARRHVTADGRSPAWSPDGRRLAFLRGDSVASEMYLVNADGTGVTRLTHNRVTEENPAWQPVASR